VGSCLLRGTGHWQSVACYEKQFNPSAGAGPPSSSHLDGWWARCEAGQEFSDPDLDAVRYPTVIPAKAGNPYAAASRSDHCCLWNTGSPAFAGDDR
jgi:hypothetical protein